MAGVGTPTNTTIDYDTYPIHSALVRGSSKEDLKSILNADPNQIYQPYHPDHNGYSPIHLIAMSKNCPNHIELLDVLQEYYIKNNPAADRSTTNKSYALSILLVQDDKNGRNILHYAAIFKRFQLVKKLLELGMPLEQDKLGWLPFHYATDGAHMSNLLDNLLKQDPGKFRNFHYQSDVYTPVQIASSRAELDALKLLHINKYSFESHRGISPIHLAITGTNNRSPVHVLTAKRKSSISDTLEFLFNEVQLNLNERTSHGSCSPKEATIPIVQNSVAIFATENTALHFAAFYQLPFVIEILVEAGANPLMVNSLGMSPLHLLVFLGESQNTIECAQVLLHKVLNTSRAQFIDLLELNCCGVEKGLTFTALEMCCRVRNNAIAAVILQTITEAAEQNDDEVWEQIWLDEDTQNLIYKEIPSAMLYTIKYQLDSTECKNKLPKKDLIAWAITGFEVSPANSNHDVNDGIKSNHIYALLGHPVSVQKSWFDQPIVCEWLDEMWSQVQCWAHFCAGAQFFVLLLYIIFMVGKHAEHQTKNSSNVTYNNAGGYSLEDTNNCLYLFNWYTGVTSYISLALLTVKECYQMSASNPSWYYFRNKYNFSQLCFGLVGIVSIFLIMFAPNIQNNNGAYVWWMSLIILAGFVLAGTVALFQLRNLPKFGIYISIFVQVIRKTFKLLLLFGCPIFIPTAGIFYILIHKGTFKSIIGVTIKVLAMTIGELGYDEIFAQNGEDSMELIQFIITLIAYSLFVFIGPIVLFNFLLAMAINVSHEMYSNAETQLRANQVEQIHLWEAFIKRFNNMFRRKRNVSSSTQASYGGIPSRQRVP